MKVQPGATSCTLVNVIQGGAWPRVRARLLCAPGRRPNASYRTESGPVTTACPHNPLGECPLISAFSCARMTLTCRLPDRPAKYIAQLASLLQNGTRPQGTTRSRAIWFDPDVRVLQDARGRCPEPTAMPGNKGVAAWPGTGACRPEPIRAVGFFYFVNTRRPQNFDRRG